MSNKAIWVLVIVLSVVLVYHFIVRPVNRDKKLVRCFNGDESSLWVDTPEDLVIYKADCYKKYGN